MNPIVSALTGQDNVSLDIGRVLLALCVMALIGLEAFSVIWRGTAFEPMGFSGSMVGLLTGGSAALYIKRGTEPTPAPK